MLHRAHRLRILLAIPLLLATGLVRARAADELRVRFVPPGTAGIDLARLSFADARRQLEQAQAGGELVLPLPFGGAGFAPIEATGCELAIDAARNAIAVAGSAQVRGRAAQVFLSVSLPSSGPSRFAFGLRPEALKLGQWFPALKGTPLADTEFQDAALVFASGPQTVPAIGPVARILGVAASGDGGLDVTAGLNVRATLATQMLPALDRLLTRLGVSAAQLAVSGRLGSDADLLFGDGASQPLDIDLHAQLDAASLAGLRSRLPRAIQPTSLVPSLDLHYAQPTGLVLGAGFDAAVDIAGQPRSFRIAATADEGAGTLALSGAMTTAWEHPLGIPWLSLPTASLTLTGDGDAAKMLIASSIRIGSRDTQLELVLGDGPPRLVARLQDLSAGDLAAFVSERTGSSFLQDLKLGDKAALRNVVLTLAKAEQPSLEVSATVVLGGASADLLFTLTGSATGRPEPLCAVRRRDGHLSDSLPSLAQKASDLQLPTSIWTLTPWRGGSSSSSSSSSSSASTTNGAADGGSSGLSLPKLSSAQLGPAARTFFAEVYGAADFEIELHPGIQFGARLPVAALPPALVKSLGIQDPKSSLLLQGSLAMNLDLGTGRPSATIQSLDLHAELPRVAGATERLPEGLPAWMRPSTSSQKTLTLRYAAPASLTFLKSNDVLADLDGATRHFLIDTEISAGESQASVSLSGSLQGDWRQPFGVKGLTLRDVTLSGGAQAQAGTDGRKSGGVTLAGSFDLGKRSGHMQMQLGAESGRGLSASFAGTLDSLSIDDLPDLDLFPNAPQAGIKALTSLLGRLPALEEPTLRVALGGGQPSVTLTAHVSVQGLRTDLLAFIANGAGGVQAVFALQPEHFSLARLFPALGKNPLVAPLANLNLDHFGLLAVHGDSRLQASSVSPEVRDFFTGLTGNKDFDLKLIDGLNLEALLPSDALPQDMADALAKLNKTMGLDGAPSLALRGGLGTSLADLRLAAALPPISPKRAPKWLKSGQLSIVLTGKPSIMLAGTLSVDADGDLLDLSLEGGVERQGGGVAIAFKSALQADKAWTSPFGLDGLEIRRFSGQVSIDALANVGFGGGGDVTIGSKDIDVFAWTKINAATGVPTGLVIKGQSAAGVGLEDLAQLQASMRAAAGAGGAARIPLDRLPDVSLRNLDLLIASRAVPEEGIDSPGFKLKGELYLPLKPGGAPEKFVSVDCGVSKEGILAKGLLAALHLGPLTWEDSSFDLEASPAAQHLIVHGKVQLLGSSSSTDLELDKEHLSFAATRDIQGLGSADLRLAADFDLKAPKFEAHGQLSSDFASQFGNSAAGEALDLGGRAAKAGKAATDALASVEGGLESLRGKLGLPTAIDAIDALAAKRVADAQADADKYRQELDALYKAWQDTPATQPVLRKAREVEWGAKKIGYDEGPLSKIKVLARRKDEYADVHAKLAAVAAAKALAQQAQVALGNEFAQISSFKGKTVVVNSASFDMDLDALQALHAGVPLDLTLDLLFCGQPKTLHLPWVVGKPAENAKTLAAALAPGLAQLVGGAVAPAGR